MIGSEVFILIFFFIILFGEIEITINNKEDD